MSGILKRATVALLACLVLSGLSAWAQENPGDYQEASRAHSVTSSGYFLGKLSSLPIIALYRFSTQTLRF